MAEFYIQAGEQVVGPLRELELREAALAKIIAVDAPISESAQGPWQSATEAGFFNEKGVAVAHRAGTTTPVCRIAGMPDAFQSPFKLRELIGFAARGMLPPNAPLQFVDADSKPTPTPPGVTVENDRSQDETLTVSSLRILNEASAGRLVLVQPGGRLLLRSSAKSQPVPDNAQSPIELAPKVDLSDRRFDAPQPAQIDPEYVAEQEKQLQEKAEVARVRREADEAEKAAEEKTALKNLDRAEAEEKKARKRAQRQSTTDKPSASHSQRPAIVLFGLLLILAASIFYFNRGHGEPIVEVSGVLTHHGSPVPDMMITFKPTKGRPSWAMTDSVGRFTLQYSRTIPEGVLIAKHKVWLTQGTNPGEEVSPEEYLEQMMAEPSIDEKGIPRDYFAEKSSDIEIEITKPTDELKIELPWQSTQ